MSTLYHLVAAVRAALNGVCVANGYTPMLMPLADDEGAALASTGYQLKPGPLKPAQFQAAHSVADFDQTINVVLIATYAPENWQAPQWEMCGDCATLCADIMALKTPGGALFQHADITRITIGQVDSEERTYGQFRITIPVIVRYRKSQEE